VYLSSWTQYSGVEVRQTQIFIGTNGVTLLLCGDIAVSLTADVIDSRTDSWILMASSGSATSMEGVSGKAFSSVALCVGMVWDEDCITGACWRAKTLGDAEIGLNPTDASGPVCPGRSSGLAARAVPWGGVVTGEEGRVDLFLCNNFAAALMENNVLRLLLLTLITSAYRDFEQLNSIVFLRI
jgi:hypothetical protein